MDWTGLWTGLDFGLDFGLNFGLWTELWTLDKFKKDEKNKKNRKDEKKKNITPFWYQLRFEVRKSKILRDYGTIRYGYNKVGNGRRRKLIRVGIQSSGGEVVNLFRGA